MKKSGKTKIAIFFLILAAFFSLSILTVFGVAADRELQAHVPIITIDPNIANCREDFPNEFTINVENTDGSGIYNIKIYKALTNIDELTCGDAPSGWNITHNPSRRGVATCKF